MTLPELRQQLIDYLVGQGIHAIPAWQGEHRLAHGQAVAAVSLKGLELRPLGHQNYLGTRLDPELGTPTAVYGRRLSLTFGLDLYAPKGAADQCSALFDQLGQAICSGGPEGLVITALECGSLRYDSSAGLLTCEATLSGEAWCYVMPREDGVLVTDIIVKGEPQV